MLSQILDRIAALKTTDDPDTREVLELCLERLLLSEGPPTTPLPGFSEGDRTDLVRSPKGRPLCLARTWTSGPWRCLVLETPSVPMGRPIFLANKTGQPGPPRTITDSRSQTFQRRIVAACHALQIDQPLGQGAVHAVVGAQRTFLAWRPLAQGEDLAQLRGDVDNYAKNLLDGLQQAGPLPNDRGVGRLSVTKLLAQDPDWTAPSASLEDHIRALAQDRRNKGEHPEAIRVELRLSRASAQRLIPDYQLPRSSTTKDPERGPRAAHEALALIRQGTPYKAARQQTHAPAKALQQLLAQELRPKVLAGMTLDDLAHSLGSDARTARKLFASDPEASKALAEHHGPRPSKHDAAKNLDRALRAVRAGLDPNTAARKHHASLASLRSRLNRAGARKKPAL